MCGDSLHRRAACLPKFLGDAGVLRLPWLGRNTMDRFFSIESVLAGYAAAARRGHSPCSAPASKANPRAKVTFKARATNASLSYVQGMAYSGGTEHRSLWPAQIHFEPFPRRTEFNFNSLEIVPHAFLRDANAPGMPRRHSSRGMSRHRC